MKVHRKKIIKYGNMEISQMFQLTNCYAYDAGRILEFDSPGVLLGDESSAFSKLVMEFLGRSRSNHDSEFT